MRKFLAIALCLLMVIPAVFVGCAKADDAKVKFGAGVYVSAPSATDATEDKDGTGKVDVTVAAVTVDQDGKIVACALDTASNSVSYTADGKAVAAGEFQTKYEIGANYNMVAYGGAAKEWFEQADAFDAACVGKTTAEIAGLAQEDGKGNADLQAAGCTITVTGFVKAATKH